METPRKKPAAAGHERLRSERAAQLYAAIVNKLTTGRMYRSPEYTARRMAKELQTDTRYISEAIARHTDGNYNALVNSFRLRDACRMMRSPRYARYTVEEIGLMAGFSSRQAFYLAFHRTWKCTPRQYRLGLDERHGSGV